jgi:hypothetical protein
MLDFHSESTNFDPQKQKKKKKTSVACIPQANYTDRAAAAC